MWVTPRWLFQSGGSLVARFQVDWNLSNRNDGRGHDYHRTHRESRELTTLLRTIHKPNERVVHGIRVPLRWPLLFSVVLVITRVIPRGGRYWDHDSIGRGNAKELIDAMHHAGFIRDDSPEYLRHVVYCQDGTTKPERGYTQVQFWTGEAYSEVRTD